MLSSEHARIGNDLRTNEARRAVLDTSLDDWQGVMDTALKFANTCGRGYRRAGDRTRKLYNTAVLQKVLVRDGHATKPEYQEPFDVLFFVPRFEYGMSPGAEAGPRCGTRVAEPEWDRPTELSQFEYGTAVGRTRSYSNWDVGKILSM
jgi:hypothetical protein